MAALRTLAIPAITARVVATGRDAARTMSDKTLDDDQKERMLQQASLTMLGAFGAISARSALAILAGLLPLVALHAAGIVALPNVGHALATWQGIALTGLVMTAVCLVKVQR